MSESSCNVRHPYAKYLRNNIYKSLNLFAGEFGAKPYDPTDVFTRKHIATKILDEYVSVSHYTPLTNSHSQLIHDSSSKNGLKPKVRKSKSALADVIDSLDSQLSNSKPTKSDPDPNSTTKTTNNELALTVKDKTGTDVDEVKNETLSKYLKSTVSSGHEIAELEINPRVDRIRRERPVWHPPWKLYRVVIGHGGWVHCVDVDVSNEWFVSGGADRLIKIWDLASCELKLSLTGHINTVRDVKISSRGPYLFSCSEDNTVKCWDIEQNKVVRSFHGHLSGVYTLSLHPQLDVLFSGGRDCVVRVWDVRSRQAVHVLTGHSATVMSLASQSAEPQILSGSQDKTVRLWDLAVGRSLATLTNHKKGVRSLAIHPTEYSFCSCAADNVKVWRCPTGEFVRNIAGHNAVLNACAIKHDGDSSVLVAGSNDGQLHFWDWGSGYKFQTLQSRVQKGSLESENAVFALRFDQSESRLITAECDKTIKIYKQDEEATEDSFPIQPQIKSTRYYYIILLLLLYSTQLSYIQLTTFVIIT